MTNLDTDWYPEIIPGFDALEWKDKVRAEIRRDTEGMTDEEICEYFRLAGERAALRRKAFARRQAAETQT
jgi:hypothetical protein